MGQAPVVLIAVLVVGVVLVVALALDVGLTVLHHARRGPFTTTVERATFWAARRLAGVTRRPGLLVHAAPAAVALTLAAWVLIAVVGFGLIVAPAVDGLSYSPSVPYGDRGLWEAVYFSGSALTTVGFGDVVAGTDALRMVTVVESAFGFALLSAGTTYVLSLLPRVSQIRSAARSVDSQAFDARQAARVVVDGGPAYLVSLHGQLLDVDEQTARFPILFYFHAEDRRGSIVTFLRGAAMVCLQARWGVAPAAAPHARLFGGELEQSLDQAFTHYAKRFMRVDDPAALDRPLPEDEARRRLAALVAAAGVAGDRDAGADPDELARFAAFTGRCDRFLEHVADLHAQPHRPLPDADGSGRRCRGY